MPIMDSVAVFARLLRDRCRADKAEAMRCRGWAALGGLAFAIVARPGAAAYEERLRADA